MSVARLVKSCSKEFHDLDQLATADPERIASIDSLGMVVAESLKSYFAQEGSKRLLHELKEAGVNLTYLGGKAACRCGPFRDDSCFDWEARVAHTFRSKGQIRVWVLR